MVPQKRNFLKKIVRNPSNTDNPPLLTFLRDIIQLSKNFQNNQVSWRKNSPRQHSLGTWPTPHPRQWRLDLKVSRIMCKKRYWCGVRGDGHGYVPRPLWTLGFEKWYSCLFHQKEQLFPRFWGFKDRSLHLGFFLTRRRKKKRRHFHESSSKNWFFF